MLNYNFFLMGNSDQYPSPAWHLLGKFSSKEAAIDAANTWGEPEEDENTPPKYEGYEVWDWSGRPVWASPGAEKVREELRYWRANAVWEMRVNELKRKLNAHAPRW